MKHDKTIKLIPVIYDKVWNTEASKIMMNSSVIKSRSQILMNQTFGHGFKRAKSNLYFPQELVKQRSNDINHQRICQV